jgi:hypothetical protein
MIGPRQEQVRALRSSLTHSRWGFLEVGPGIPGSEDPGCSKCGAATNHWQNGWTPRKKVGHFFSKC